MSKEDDFDLEDIAKELYRPPSTDDVEKVFGRYLKKIARLSDNSFLLSKEEEKKNMRSYQEYRIIINCVAWYLNQRLSESAKDRPDYLG